MSSPRIWPALSAIMYAPAPLAVSLAFLLICFLRPTSLSCASSRFFPLFSLAPPFHGPSGLQRQWNAAFPKMALEWGRVSSGSGAHAVLSFNLVSAAHFCPPRWKPSLEALSSLSFPSFPPPFPFRPHARCFLPPGHTPTNSKSIFTPRSELSGNVTLSVDDSSGLFEPSRGWGFSFAQVLFCLSPRGVSIRRVYYFHVYYFFYHVIVMRQLCNCGCTIFPLLQEAKATVL